MSQRKFLRRLRAHTDDVITGSDVISSDEFIGEGVSQKLAKYFANLATFEEMLPNLGTKISRLKHLLLGEKLKSWLLSPKMQC